MKCVVSGGHLKHIQLMKVILSWLKSRFFVDYDLDNPTPPTNAHIFVVDSKLG